VTPAGTTNNWAPPENSNVCDNGAAPTEPNDPVATPAGANTAAMTNPRVRRIGHPHHHESNSASD
jgi:hypothetical protein